MKPKWLLMLCLLTSSASGCVTLGPIDTTCTDFKPIRGTAHDAEVISVQLMNNIYEHNCKWQKACGQEALECP